MNNHFKLFTILSALLFLFGCAVFVGDGGDTIIADVGAITLRFSSSIRPKSR